MFEFLYDNLVVHTHVYYNVQRGKRVYSDTVTEEMKNDSYFEFDAQLYPPLMLLPITWQRYGYTLEDVNENFGKVDASYVWALCLLLLASVYEPESSSAGVRSTFQSLFTFLFISRKTVFDIFISSQSQYISSSSQSILCHERDDHKPLLPKVYVNKALFDRCRAQVPVRHPSFCWTPLYQELIPFKDIWLVPVEYDHVNDLVYMVRVVKKEVYDAIPVKPKLCVVTMPVIAEFQQVEYVLLEEACFFAVDIGVRATNSKRRSKRRKIHQENI